MKRLLVLVFIGAALFTIGARHRSRAWAGDHYVVQRTSSGAYVQVPVQRYDGYRPAPVVTQAQHVYTAAYQPDADGRVVVVYREAPEPKKAPVPPRPPAPPRTKGRAPQPTQAPVQAQPATPAETKITPDWFPRTSEEEAAAAKGDSRGYRALVSGLASSESKARNELHQKIERDVTQWIAGDVAIGWKPSTSTVDSLIRATYVKPVIEDTGAISKDLDELVTLYRAGAMVDFSKPAREQVINSYNREIVRDRTIKVGSILTFILVVLAALSSYIRADEATKGYYTNRLRVLTAAGVGAAGVVLYRFLA